MREAQEKQVLVDILTVAARLKLPMLVVGAGARILIFDRRYNIEGRATTDLDFAVRVDSWSDYQSLSAEMTHGSNPCFRATDIPHKFIHIQTGTEVDLVPFGPIGQPNQQIEWSDGNQMSLLGLDEALSSAEVLTMEGIEFKVVNTAAFLVLKLIAWNDRKAAKDLEDVYFILNKYEDDRIYEELADELSQGLIEFEQAAGFLLGRDIQKIFNEATIIELNKILSQILQNSNTLFPQLISYTVDTEEWDAKFDIIVCRFEALQRGIEYINYRQTS